MGFLSKLFGGDKTAEKAAEDLLKGIFGGQNNPPQSNAPAAPDPVPAAPASGGWEESSDSQWDRIPSEPNQYNYGGHFLQYFEEIFAAELSGYRMEKTTIDGRRYVYTFYGSAGKALVVELMPESCSARKLRNDTQREGVAYLRFYYDHKGWWNTRSYVSSRLHGAVG